MIVLYLRALAAIALSLSALMAGAWMAQQRTGNSGRVDFSLGPVGAGSALWPVADVAPGARHRDHHSPASRFFPPPPQKGVVT
jgi:steroid 5-alpha reductase family enzyme